MKTQDKIFNFTLIVFLLLNSCIRNEKPKNNSKPYSLENDKKQDQLVWERNKLKILPDSLVNRLIYIFRFGTDEEKENSIQTLYRFKDDRIPKLLDSIYLLTDSKELMMNIGFVLRYYDYKKSIPTFKKALNNPDTEIQLYAAFNLAALGEKEECLKIFKSQMNNPDFKLLSGINRGLRNINTPEAIELLIKNTANTNSYVACGAAICLAQAGYYDSAYPVLYKMLSIDSEKVGALTGLAYIGDDRSINLIKSMLNDKDKRVRDRSMIILKEYGIIKKN